MERREREEAEIWTNVVLGSLVAAACVAGTSRIIESLALTPIAGAANAVASAGRSCDVCGVVDEVRQLEPAAMGHEVSTVAGGGAEGILVILGVLGRKIRLEPVTTYEVAVRMQDGSFRAFRSASVPAWKPGTRVKIIMGRIERDS